jgi:glucose/arabinose dehydrogenase
MRRVSALLSQGLLLATLATGNALADNHIQHSALHDYRVMPFVEGLNRPWGLAFLPGGGALVTEKGGQLRMVRNGQLLEQPLGGTPEVVTEGQAGLLDVALHPGFAQNQLVYLSYSKPLSGSTATTAVIRGRLEGQQLVGVEEIFEAQSSGRGHYGSRLAFDNDGYLYITVGDRQASPSGNLEKHPAQDLGKHQGVVVRLHDDGRVPDDNPFAGQRGALPETWSYGHRNPQGMAFDETNNRLWITEHGPQGGDELNLVRPGLNYGWPVIGYGVQYGKGDTIHATTTREGMEQPVHFWVPSIGIAGLALYQGDAFPNWNGAMLAGGLASETVALLHMNGTSVTREETLPIHDGRVRDVVVGPDGLVYLAIDQGEGEGKILRLEPVPRAEIAAGKASP